VLLAYSYETNAELTSIPEGIGKQRLPELCIVVF
jgi:hypothetical protein